MIKDIRSRCGCLPGYMNLNHNDLAKSCSLYGMSHTVCGNFKLPKFHHFITIFLDHGKCVSPVLKKFDYLNCTCLQACETKLPTPQIIQYGWAQCSLSMFTWTKPYCFFKEIQRCTRNAEKITNQYGIHVSCSAFHPRPKWNYSFRNSRLSWVNSNSNIFSRILYSALDQFLSDVGGAAGLVLGVSLATLVGFLDCCLVSFFRFFHLRKDLVIYRFLLSGTVFQRS